MAAGGKDRGGRELRERARLYQARQQFQAGLGRRRTRDNVIAGVAGGLLIAGALFVQTLYFTSGPGTPTPTPSVSTSPSATSTPEATITPTPTASSDGTPAATETPAP